MPFWDRKIDVVVLTHPDSDHMNAQIETPLRFAIDYGVETEISQQNPDADPWRRALASQDVAIQIQRTGGWIDLGDGVALWVLWPPPGGFQAESVDNENSLVLKLVYGDFSVLLTGDAGLTSEAAWMQAKLPLTATVLKVGHHGSSHSTGKDLVAAVDPQIAVIQVSAENKYGHPTDEVLDILRGRLVLRNDQQGAIQIVSDGRQMWVTQETGSQQLE
jgi:competence protein ComEC